MRTTASKRQSSLELAQAVSRLLDRIHLDEFDLDEVRRLAGQALQGEGVRPFYCDKNPDGERPAFWKTGFMEHELPRHKGPCAGGLARR